MSAAPRQAIPRQCEHGKGQQGWYALVRALIAGAFGDVFGGINQIGVCLCDDRQKVTRNPPVDYLLLRGRLRS
jgi:hypothetical protein